MTRGVLRIGGHEPIDQMYQVTLGITITMKNIPILVQLPWPNVSFSYHLSLEHPGISQILFRRGSDGVVNCGH